MRSAPRRRRRCSTSPIRVSLESLARRYRRCRTTGAHAGARRLSAGHPLPFLDRSADAPGAQVAPILVGALEDAALLAELASRNDVVTFDWENISGAALAPLEKLTSIRPPRAALEVSQDRLQEKALFRRLKIPVAAHAAVDSREQLRRGGRKLGVPGRAQDAAPGLRRQGSIRAARRARTSKRAWDAHRRRRV